MQEAFERTFLRLGEERKWNVVKESTISGMSPRDDSSIFDTQESNQGDSEVYLPFDFFLLLFEKKQTPFLDMKEVEEGKNSSESACHFVV